MSASADLDLAALREVAGKATPPDIWMQGGARDNRGYDSSGNLIFECHDCDAVANAQFIAAFNPQTALALLDALEEARRECEKATSALRSSGFVRCDIPACNCGSWHQSGGFKARFDEIKEAVEEAGFSTQGRTLLDAVKVALSQPTASDRKEQNRE